MDKNNDYLKGILSNISSLKPYKYTVDSDKGKIKIKILSKEKTETLDGSEKLGYILICCLCFSVLNYIFTHLFYLTPLITIGIIIFLYVFYSNFKNNKIFLQKVLVPCLLISCLLSSCIAYNRMNNLYTADVNMQKEEIIKVHENIPKWVYSLKNENKK